MEKEDLICPITQLIFRKPVVADDNQTYEESALKAWLKENPLSPITREPIRSYHRSVLIEQLVEKYLEENPIDKEDQTTKILKSYLNNKTKIAEIIKHKNWDKLKGYNEVDLFHFLKTTKKLKEIPLDVIKHLIDHAIYLQSEDSNLEKNQQPIHYFARYAEPEAIQYLIDKGVNLECENSKGERPIHLVCCHSTPEMIKYIIDKGVHLEVMDNNQRRPIHCICTSSTPEMVKYIIDKGCNFECENNKGERPIHLLCQEESLEIIEYLAEKGADLECMDNDGWRPIHYAANFSSVTVIKYLISKGCDLMAKIKNLSDDARDVEGYQSTILYLLMNNENDGIKLLVKELMKDERFINMFLGFV